MGVTTSKKAAKKWDDKLIYVEGTLDSSKPYSIVQDSDYYKLGDEYKCPTTSYHNCVVNGTGYNVDNTATCNSLQTIFQNQTENVSCSILGTDYTVTDQQTCDDLIAKFGTFKQGISVKISKSSTMRLGEVKIFDILGVDVASSATITHTKLGDDAGRYANTQTILDHSIYSNNSSIIVNVENELAWIVFTFPEEIYIKHIQIWGPPAHRDLNGIKIQIFNVDGTKVWEMDNLGKYMDLKL